MMEDVAATHIEQRLAQDRLLGLITLLQKYHKKVIIAGSYTFAIHPEDENDERMGPGDMDIWIPWLPNHESAKILGEVLAFFVDSGYTKILSQTHKWNPEERRHDPDHLHPSLDSYKRMDYMIDTIYTVQPMVVTVILCRLGCKVWTPSSRPDMPSPPSWRMGVL